MPLKEPSEHCWKPPQQGSELFLLGQGTQPLNHARSLGGCTKKGTHEPLLPTVTQPCDTFLFKTLI